MKDTLLKQLLNSPQLVNYYQEIKEFLYKENQKKYASFRRFFYALNSARLYGR